MIQVTREKTIGIMQQANSGSVKVKNSKSKKGKGENREIQDGSIEVDPAILERNQGKESAGENYRTEFDSPGGLVVCDFPPLEKAGNASGEKISKSGKKSRKALEMIPASDHKKGKTTLKNKTDKGMKEGSMARLTAESWQNRSDGEESMDGSGAIRKKVKKKLRQEIEKVPAVTAQDQAITEAMFEAEEEVNSPAMEQESDEEDREGASERELLFGPNDTMAASRLLGLGATAAKVAAVVGLEKPYVHVRVVDRGYNLSELGATVAGVAAVVGQGKPYVETMIVSRVENLELGATAAEVAAVVG